MNTNPPLPDTCKAAVFHPENQALELRSFDLPEPAPGQVLVRITRSAICGSDLHTFLGHRSPPAPLVLGHESCGTIVRLGETIENDAGGEPLRAGDRVTWSIAADCGNCFYCGHDLPQKCEHLFKYGHETIDKQPPLSGGFAEYIYLAPGSSIYKIPPDLEDNDVVFANCAAATMAAAHRIANTGEGDTVLIQGAGLLGLCASAMAAAAGASRILVTDALPERLALATEFGATDTMEVKPDAPNQLLDFSRETAGPRGFDAAIEVCGQPQAVADALPVLRTGATCVLAGCVFPGAEATLNLHTITTRLLRLNGLHNYKPSDLLMAVKFLEATRDRFPFHKVVAAEYPLADISQAFKHAINQKNALRIAIVPE